MNKITKKTASKALWVIVFSLISGGTTKTTPIKKVSQRNACVAKKSKSRSVQQKGCCKKKPVKVATKATQAKKVQLRRASCLKKQVASRRNCQKKVTRRCIARALAVRAQLAQRQTKKSPVQKKVQIQNSGTKKRARVLKAVAYGAKNAKTVRSGSSKRCSGSSCRI